MKGRIAATGAVAVAAYLIAASAHLLPIPQRALYDGTGPPPPYIWVSPPPDANANGTPTAGNGTITFEAAGSQAKTITTQDQGVPQAIVIFPSGAFTPKKGEAFVHVAIAPKDPGSFAPAPAGMQFDGNAYTISATYGSSKRVAALRAKSCDGDNQKLCPTVALRFALGATALLRWDGSTWATVPSGASGASLQLFATTPSLGTYTTIAPIGATPKAGGSGLAGYIAALIGTAALAAALGISRRPRVREWWTKRWRATKRSLKR